MANEILELIKTRRSIRSYQSGQIPKESLDMILEAATYAPSAGNRQSWLFTVIQNPEVLKELNELVRVAMRDSTPVPGEYPGITSGRERAKDPGYIFHHNAPTLVVVSNLKSYANAMPECSIATQNMFLVAKSLGISSCWVNQIHWMDDDRNLRNYLEKLGIPKDHTICGSAVLGYIYGEWPEAAPRKPVIKIIP